MLDEKRIKNAEKNVRIYLADKLLEKKTNSTAKSMYVRNSKMSLETAQKVLSLKSEKYSPYLWVIVPSYYSMYYIANAVLLELGYKVGRKISHKVTVDALIVFVRNKLRRRLVDEYEETKGEALELMSQTADSLIYSLDQERQKRSRFQYEMDEQLKREKALTSLKRAKRFFFEMKKLL